MPICSITRCDACSHERQFWSDALYLQLDDGSLTALPHPQESSSCEDFGLTLSQASQRRRLFAKDFFVCRHCGAQSFTIQRKKVWLLDSDQQSPWEVFKFSLSIVCVAMPILLWFHRWDLAVIFVVAMLIVCIESRREMCKRRSEGKRTFSTDDAPGKVSVPEPKPSNPCCERPDLIPGFQVKDEDQIPCRECQTGKLKVIGAGIS